ncbi:hypothetical protein BMF94_1929 [Rhodotorula taiwanensis]|uniref:Uncharacterized protein n=1 Tax=Rhodotorula taiwanensis TaxID=741276 RepID=A0A2S5BDX4_9BASI|nr:hypothetical protein BMF94_1929 [Rhodotorula taiwanensis]
MLAKAKLVACRCVSTSTAGPCRHGIATTVRRVATSSKSAAAAAVQRETCTEQAPVAALDYTAPLWATTAAAQQGRARWFGPARPAWADWNRTDLQPAPARDPPPPKVRTPPDAPLQVSSKVDEARPFALRDAAEAQLSTYLRSRGQRTALESFRDDYRDLLDAAERGDMPLLRAMVLEDQELAQVPHRGLKLLELDRFATNRSQKDGEGHMHRVVSARLPAPGEVVTRGRRKRRAALARTSSPAPAPEQVPPETVSPYDCLSSFLTVPVSDIAAAGEAWHSFDRATRADQSDRDLHLAIRFLFHLVQPGRPGSKVEELQPRLQLALQVLHRLLDVFPDEVVQPEPTRTDLFQEVRLQVVLLRTAIEVARREHMYETVESALGSIDQLREVHPVLATSPESAFDITAVESEVRRGLGALRDERQTSYAPSLRAEAWKMDAEVARVARVVRYRYRWSTSVADPDQPTLAPRLDQFLNTFAAECAHRQRWDLVAEMWRLWSARGWHMDGQALSLARWFAGEMPSSTYGPGPLAKTVLQPRLFVTLAREVHADVQRGSQRVTWTAGEKNDWVDLLCASRVASRSTREMARELVSIWQRKDPVGSALPFVLRGSTLLNLLRTALPPYGTDSTYARSGLSAHVATLVNPSSPYSSPNGRIEHYDLTTLAQAFTLAGDHVSVGQIYRRALEQKQLPDAKDVTVVLADAARRYPRGAFEQVAKAAASGLGVDLELIQAVLKAQLDQLRSRSSQASRPVADVPEEMREAVAQACRLAQELRLSEGQTEHLRRYGEAYISAGLDAASKPGRADGPSKLSVGRIIGDLLKASQTTDWRLAHRVFVRTLVRDEAGATVAHGVRDERVLTLCLGTLLKADRAKGYRAERPEIRDALRQVLDAAVAPISRLQPGETPLPAGNVSLVSTRAGLDLVLEALIRIGLPADVDALMAALDRQAESLCEPGLQPTDAVVEKAVRWAIAHRGRAAVLADDGWLAQRAQAIIRPEPTTETRMWGRKAVAVRV